MAAPAALVLAKILIPETRPRSAVDARHPTTDAGEATQPSTARATSATDAAVEDLADAGPKNVIDAAATGAADGLQLALNIGAMLIAFLALIAMPQRRSSTGAAGLFGYTTSLEMHPGRRARAGRLADRRADGRRRPRSAASSGRR